MNSISKVAMAVASPVLIDVPMPIHTPRLTIRPKNLVTAQSSIFVIGAVLEMPGKPERASVRHSGGFVQTGFTETEARPSRRIIVLFMNPWGADVAKTVEVKQRSSVTKALHKTTGGDTEQRPAKRQNDRAKRELMDDAGRRRR